MKKDDLLLSTFANDPEIVAFIQRKRAKEIEKQIQTVETIRGEQGDKGEKGDPGKDGRDGIDGSNGRDGSNGKDGISIVGPRGEHGIDGIPGKDGKNGADAVFNSEDFVGIFIEYIKKEKPLDISHIRNASTFMRDGIRYKIEELMHGGGSTPSFIGENLLSTITGIDATQISTINLYTALNKGVITGATIRCTAAVGVSVVPSLGIGIAAGEDNIFDALSLTGFNATSKIFKFTSIGTLPLFQTGDIIKLGIDTGATATSMVIAVDLFGYPIN